MHPIRKIAQVFGIDIHRYKHTPHKLSWLKNESIATIFDIGANTGQFATEIRNVLPDVQMYSFEPLSDCFRELTTNLATDKHFLAINTGIGLENKRTTIHRSQYSLSSSFREMSDNHKTLFPHTANSIDETVELQRLDDAAKQLNVQKELLIKVDVQGYEDSVINGGLDTFKQAKIVIIETSFISLYEGQPLFDKIYVMLTDLGFSYAGNTGQKMNPKNGKAVSEDSIFIRRTI